MKTKTQIQVALDSARYELGDALERVKELRVKIANLRLDVAAERALNRSARVAEREARVVAREQKRAAKIAAMEQRLADLRLKASAPKQIRKNYRKASEGVVYTPEQIAELNKTLGLLEV
jgi:DNA repair exonuclease SbcCD ATPase subunit